MTRQRQYLDIRDSLLKQALDRGEAVQVSFSGTSMEPYFHTGDTLVLASADRPVKAGEVVAYRRHDKLITHVVHGQVKWRGRCWYLCKGAANRLGDYPVARESLLGVVTHVRRDGRLMACVPVRTSWTSMVTWRHLVVKSLYQRLVQGAGL